MQPQEVKSNKVTDLQEDIHTTERESDDQTEWKESTPFTRHMSKFSFEGN